MKSLPNKIKNLNNIKSIAKVPKYYYFNFKLFKKKKIQILKNIKKNFKIIIIRSASFNEDNNTSNAGKYLSIPNIDSNNSKKVEISIEEVFNSYRHEKKNQFILLMVKKYLVKLWKNSPQTILQPLMC